MKDAHFHKSIYPEGKSFAGAKIRFDGQNRPFLQTQVSLQKCSHSACRTPEQAAGDTGQGGISCAYTDMHRQFFNSHRIKENLNQEGKYFLFLVRKSENGIACNLTAKG